MSNLDKYEKIYSEMLEKIMKDLEHKSEDDLGRLEKESFELMNPVSDWNQYQVAELLLRCITNEYARRQLRTVKKQSYYGSR